VTFGCASDGHSLGSMTGRRRRARARRQVWVGRGAVGLRGSV
jgi:hypothetical protein